VTAVLHNLSQLPEALAEAGLDVERHRDLIARVRAHVAKYTEMEKELVGEVSLSFPAYLLETRLPEDPIAAGERLAELERERLGLGETEAGDLMSLLDRQGFKIYRPAFPEDSPVEGVFAFDAAAGPVFLVNGSLAGAESGFTLARLYGHFLVDNSPYRIRVVVSGEAGADPVDLRARSFGAAFLVPKRGLDRYLAAAGIGSGHPIDAGAVYQLAVYFEVGYRAVLTRLLALEYIDAESIEPLLGELEECFEPPTVPHRPGAVPERFVRLALEANARGTFNLDTLARLLETDPAAARELADAFTLEPDAQHSRDREPGDADPRGEAGAPFETEH